jgi:cytoskeletal protein RodZ
MKKKRKEKSIMANLDFDEHQIEELLRKMPIIRDRQNLEEVYRKVQSRRDQKYKKKRALWIPAATIAAIAIIMVLAVSMLYKEQPKSSNGSKTAAIQKNANLTASSVSQHHVSKQESTYQQTAGEKADTVKGKQVALSSNKIESVKKQDIVNRSSVYTSDLTDHAVYTYGVLTHNEIAVPVSVVVPKSSEEWFTKYKQIASQAPKQEWGFDQFVPLKSSMTYDSASQIIQITVNQSQTGNIPESLQLNLDKLVNYSFRYMPVKEAEFRNEKGEHLSIGEIGEVKNIQINKTPQSGYYSYKAGDRSYLVPSDQSYKQMSDALAAMKKSPNDLYHSVLMGGLGASVLHQDGKNVTVKFDRRVDLTKESQMDAMNMIEGILLTGKDFGNSTVTFQNIVPSKWNGFDFSKAIEVPVAPNRIEQ